MYAISCTTYTVRRTMHSVRGEIFAITCTTYTVRLTMYSVRSEMYAICFTTYTVRRTMYSVRGKMFAISCMTNHAQCTWWVYAGKCTTHIICGELYAVKCLRILYAVSYAVSLPCALWFVRDEIYYVQYTAYIVHCEIYTVSRSTLYDVHHVLYVIYCMRSDVSDKFLAI